MIDSYGSDWLISASVEELDDKLDLFEKTYGKPVKFNIGKTNFVNLTFKNKYFYSTITGNIFEIGQKINGKVAIVNPANTDGLGCFNSEHKCIDNQLHRYEGPRLRLLLSKLPIKNNKRLEIAQPIITNTFRLNLDYVIHIVTPDCSNRIPDSNDWNKLIKCYDNCIKIADYYNIEYILFPTIGTGIFGFPKNIAAKYVHDYLVNSATNRKVNVVLCLYDSKDINAYN